MIRGFVLSISFAYQYGFINTKKRLECLTGSADNNYIKTNKGKEMYEVVKAPGEADLWFIEKDGKIFDRGPFFFRSEAQERVDELNGEEE